MNYFQFLNKNLSKVITSWQYLTSSEIQNILKFAYVPSKGNTHAPSVIRLRSSCYRAIKMNL